jgi:hypothetical protein
VNVDLPGNCRGELGGQDVQSGSVTPE